MKTYRVAVGADFAGLEYKELLIRALRGDKRVAEVLDINPEENENYPGVAFSVAQLVVNQKADRAILICGTGIGMAISANKVKGVRASTAHDSYSVERLVLSNDAQILCLGQRVIGIELAKKLVFEWLGYEFDTTSNSTTKILEILTFESNSHHNKEAK